MRRKTPANYYVLAKERGFRWLGPEVPNVCTKTKWLCSKAHEWEATYGNIRSGYGCPHCYGNAPKTPADYHALAKEHDLKWLGSGQLTTRTKTKWECSKKHRWEATYGSIQGGSGCPFCAVEKIKAKPDDYRVLAEKHGFYWLGPEISTTKVKTRWECKYGHQWETCYSSIQQGRGCPHCANRVPKTAKDYHALASEWTGGDYHALTIEWIGKELPLTTMAKTRWRCSRGHEWETYYNSIQQGTGCPHCCNEWRAKLTKTYWENGLYDAECLRKISESKKAAWAQGVYDTPDYRQKISRARKDAHTKGIYDGVFQSPTSIEIETAKALDTIDLKHQSQYRPKDYSRVYDEFIPPNILIEIHGDYWHGPQRPEIQKRDAQKAEWAANNYFTLVVFWEHEIKEQGALALIHERISPLLRKKNL